MIAKMMCTVIDCPDPAALGAFYARVLGGRLDNAEPGWSDLFTPDGHMVSFQKVADYRPPRWPSQEHPQQLHLDFEVATRQDAERARGEVEALGATFLHDSGGEVRGFIVFADPVGHPFCICYGQPPQG
ncbi:VOC family protein [Streptomyces sp. UNOC14_S4]|uniref:VOC family protein n=1 Tax=Streptomyces sp. UNOC14_S4 TaxID=2872340 RepID=UPI001E32126E|nr:VOC family protein [Streptomyces sp. UNOC14_S4]MCC3772927.1 VOC family protein [Streptomyces sp. UNOC14_S4]